MAVRVFGRATVSSLLGDRVLYRRLEPFSRSFSGLAKVAPELGIAAGRIPRKGDTDYARAVAEILSRLAADRTGRPVERFLVVGDGLRNDGGVFRRLSEVTGWPGRALIASDQPDSFPPHLHEAEPGLWQARRWKAVEAFAGELARESFPIGASTAVLIDIDKTLLGARGRNDAPIDAARLGALRETVASILGRRAESAAIAGTISELTQTLFHPATEDNQDYVAYITVFASMGVLPLEWVRREIESGAIARFEDVLAAVEARKLPADSASFHSRIASLVRAGDPTPFKEFRRREFRHTRARMGCGRDDAPAQALLAEEIVLTAEVFHAAQRWQADGALLLGLSDKPDEAALPPEGSSLPPLHRTETHLVGEM